tara:strand:- start:472 stop:630 length:159 start_codon:yes stop_codon:yes gene_type:complete
MTTPLIKEKIEHYAESREFTKTWDYTLINIFTYPEQNFLLIPERKYQVLVHY